MKKLVSGTILIIIGIVVGVGAFALVETDQVLESLGQFPVLGFGAIFLLTLAASLIANWRHQIIFRSAGMEFSFWKLYAIWLAGNAFNFVTPVMYLGGEGVKAYLLNERFKVDWKRTMPYLAMDRMLEITAGLFVLLGAAGVFIFYTGLENLANSVVGIIGAVGAAFFLFGFIYFLIFSNRSIFHPILHFFAIKHTRFGKFMLSMEDKMMQFFDLRSGAMWGAWILSLLKQGLFLLRQGLLIYYLGKGFIFGAALLSLGVLYLGFTVPVPGALGVQEALQSIYFSIAGLGGGSGFALSLVLRGVDVFFVAVGVYVLLKHGVKLMASGVAGIMKSKLNNPYNKNNG